ncbi:unnamed protein product, partial [Prorocentrum cordatum]
AIYIYLNIEPLCSPADASDWMADLTSLPDSPDLVHRLVDKAADVCKLARGKVKASNSAGVRKWLKDALPGGARKVRNWLKSDDKVAVEYLVAPDGIRQTPNDMMKYRHDFWARWWAPTKEHLQVLNDTLGELRSHAQTFLLELPELEPRDILQ